ncbi:MAG: DUF5655 domain-containing protein [Thermoleophilia bacterium]
MTRRRCTRCGRELRAPDQAHACRPRTLDEHFARRPPALREAFDALLAACLAAPRVEVEPLPATIHLAAGRPFAIVTPRRETLKLALLLDRALDDPRIVRREALPASRHVHTLLLRGPDEVDDALIAWLREAQALAG